MFDAVPAAPCSNCPFRKDVPIYLHRERRYEIAQSIIDGHDFSCHKTVDYDVEDDEEPNTADSKICAGAAKSILLQGGTTQMMRIAERLGMADLDRTEDSAVEVWSLDEWTEIEEGSTGDNRIEAEPIETCTTCGPGCIAPAGFLGAGGGVVRGSEEATEQCKECGDPVCEVCISENGMCDFCLEYEENEDDLT